MFLWGKIYFFMISFPNLILRKCNFIQKKIFPSRIIFLCFPGFFVLHTVIVIFHAYLFNLEFILVYKITKFQTSSHSFP